MKEWIFDSPERMKLVAIGLAVLSVVLMVALTLNRVAGSGGGRDMAPAPVVSDEPYTGPTDLVPPSPAPEGASPTPDYGSSAGIALEAVNAFLLNDSTRFAELAQPEAVEGINEAPARPAGQEVTGRVKTLLPGPTRQQVLVPTTDGDLVLDMVVIDGAWKVMSIEYAR